METSKDNTAALQAEITKLKAKIKDLEKTKGGVTLPFGYSVGRVGGQLEIVINAKERDAAEHVITAANMGTSPKDIVREVKAYYNIDIDEAKVSEILAYPV